MIRRPPRSTLLSLHDALPICPRTGGPRLTSTVAHMSTGTPAATGKKTNNSPGLSRATKRCCERTGLRSEEHTSELQSQSNLVCRLLLEKKHKHQPHIRGTSKR